MRSGRIWWLWLVAGALAIGLYFLLPAGGLAQDLTYGAIGLASGVAILVAIRLHRPPGRAMWMWFAAGQLAWVAGDAVYGIYQGVLHVAPYPSPADGIYLAGYPMLVFGLVVLLRGRTGQDRMRLIDAAIVAIGLGLVFWVFVLHPVAAAPAGSPVERAISTAYPAADALLLVLLAGLFTGSGSQTVAARLLGVAMLLQLVADVTLALLTRYADYEGGPLDGFWLLSYLMWAAAALHPSMRAPAGPPDAATHNRIGPRRLIVMAASSQVGLGILFVPGVASDQIDRITIRLGSMLLFTLVVVRMWGFVAETQRQAAQLADLAMRDDLTGLANRRRFEHELRAALATGRPYVALLDLDAFKRVNDDLGHSVGDQLLVSLAGRLGTAINGDALVARMGGDEFAVLIPDADRPLAQAMVDRLAGALREPIRAGGHELLVGGGIGLADGTGTGDPLEVLRRADIAMYEAKETAEAYRWYTDELDLRAGEEARIGAELRTALDCDQFRLVYQPIVELPRGRIVAAEALVRWAHPERGVVPPVEFIPVSERNGLIIELGAWVLREACLQAAQWRAERGADAPERISVNVSAKQLARPRFAAVVEAALTESGLPARCLTVEVTETAVFEGGRALETLAELRAMGVSIALDDFGTGHSSLDLLQTVPVDILKVDKSFVDNITMAGRHAVIATALIQVADGLGLAAVAEGVETPEQAAELHRLGYRLAQGYHFGRPAAELPAVIAGHRQPA